MKSLFFILFYPSIFRSKPMRQQTSGGHGNLSQVNFIPNLQLHSTARGSFTFLARPRTTLFFTGHSFPTKAASFGVNGRIWAALFLALLLFSLMPKVSFMFLHVRRIVRCSISRKCPRQNSCRGALGRRWVEPLLRNHV